MTQSPTARQDHRKTRVLLVDDHPLVLHGLSQLVNAQDDMEVCGEASDPRAALEALHRLNPDLAIVDLMLGDADGLELVRAMTARRRDLPVLVCSMHKESLYAERALRAGARGYVAKQEDNETILRAVRRVISGEVHVSDRMASHMLLKLVNPAATPRAPAAGGPPPLERLSDREFEIFRLIGRGLGPTEIARQTGVSVKTVETHQDHIKRKLGAANSRELLRLAMRHVDDSPGGRR